jgi:hypothetical protein
MPIPSRALRLFSLGILSTLSLSACTPEALQLLQPQLNLGETSTLKPREQKTTEKPPLDKPTAEQDPDLEKPTEKPGLENPTADSSATLPMRKDILALQKPLLDPELLKRLRDPAFKEGAPVLEPEQLSPELSEKLIQAGSPYKLAIKRLEDFKRLPRINFDPKEIPKVSEFLQEPLLDKTRDFYWSDKLRPDPVAPFLSRNRGPGGTELTIHGLGFGTSADNGAIQMDGFLGSVNATVLNWSNTEIRVRIPEQARPGANRVRVQVGSATFDLNFVVTSVSLPHVFVMSMINQPLSDFAIRLHNHRFNRRDSRPYYYQPDGSFIRMGGQTRSFNLYPQITDLGVFGTMESYIRLLESDSSEVSLENLHFVLKLNFESAGTEVINYNTAALIPRALEDDALPNLDMRNISLTADLQLQLSSSGQLDYRVSDVDFRTTIDSSNVMLSIVGAFWDYEAAIKQAVESQSASLLNSASIRAQMTNGLNQQIRQALELPSHIAFRQLRQAPPPNNAIFLSWD